MVLIRTRTAPRGVESMIGFTILDTALRSNADEASEPECTPALITATREPTRHSSRGSTECRQTTANGRGLAGRSIALNASHTDLCHFISVPWELAPGDLERFQQPIE
jgi:hypothetical protein